VAVIRERCNNGSLITFTCREAGLRLLLIVCVCQLGCCIARKGSTAPISFAQSPDFAKTCGQVGGDVLLERGRGRLHLGLPLLFEHQSSSPSQPFHLVRFLRAFSPCWGFATGLGARPHRAHDLTVSGALIHPSLCRVCCAVFVLARHGGVLARGCTAESCARHLNPALPSYPCARSLSPPLSSHTQPTQPAPTAAHTECHTAPHAQHTQPFSAACTWHDAQHAPSPPASVLTTRPPVAWHGAPTPGLDADGPCACCHRPSPYHHPIVVLCSVLLVPQAESPPSNQRQPWPCLIARQQLVAAVTLATQVAVLAQPTEGPSEPQH
jgi:hypothetical protein